VASAEVTHEDEAILKARARVQELERKLVELERASSAKRTRGAGHGRINPPLEPVSDKKFFGKTDKRPDYPTDERPAVRDHFSFPFPEVQDSHDFAEDYVKDENSDNGEHAASAMYDKLRSQIAETKAKAESAKAKVAEEEKELAESKKAEAEAAKKAKDEAKKAEEAAKAKAKAAQKHDATNKTIVEAEKLLRHEVTDLEDCKAQLHKAKEHLEKLVSDKEAKDKAAANSQAELGAAKQEEAAVAGSDESVERKVAREQEEHAKAEKLEKATAEDIKKTESDLDAAAKKLSKFRKADDGKGQNGGVHGNNGGASRVAAPALALLGSVFALCLA